MMSSSHRSPHSPGSSKSSTPRIGLSPLNPASPPPIAISQDPNTVSLRPLHPGNSTPNLVQLSDPIDHPSQFFKVTSPDGTSSSMPSSLSNHFDDNIKSTFRDLSKSPRRMAYDQGQLLVEDSDHFNLSLTSWWGDSAKHVHRPWHNSPKKQKTVPLEQTEALQNTRTRVAQAIASALGTAADIGHEALFIGVDLLALAPVPGLQPAARILLDIWDASRLVDLNRLGCLRLTERCADILISVRLEISNAGDVLEQELAAPIQKLEESFQGVYHFLMKQSSRPFLKRYLRRDQILRDISDLDSSLRDALGLFGVSIQIRILKQVEESEQHREAETKALFEAIADRASDSTLEHETAAHPTDSLGLIDDRAPSSQDLPHSQIIPALTSLHSLQDFSDMEMDTGDLRQLIRTALQTKSDVEMLEVLQVGRQEMPDALKTLQRALERERSKDRGNDDVETLPENSVLKEVEERGAPRKRSETVISLDTLSTISSGHGIERDTLDREFIESGIEALRRMSRGVETSLPSWTITKYEIDLNEQIGIGFFSDVYRGTWQGRTVAIKVLADSTPRKLFVHEMGIWKTLRHHNVSPLYGASSASGDPPWFFVSPYMKNGSLVQYLKRVELEERPSNLGIGMGLSQMPIRIPESNLGSGTFTVRGTSLTQRDLTPPGSRGGTPEDTVIHREWNLFRFMHEIAKGMEYLHSRGVLHGDLKGANVLVDDKYRCVISDFGQSEMKSEAFRIRGTLVPHGTLRWQSPELMAGSSQLTREIDVWAFSMCCVEILTMGRIPWGHLHSDDSVLHLVLEEDGRPPLPDNSRSNTQGLQDILRTCWNTKPDQRPTFSKLVKDFKQLRKSCGQEVVDSPRISVPDEVSERTASPSPDMRPTRLPESTQPVDNDLPDSDGRLPELGNIFQMSRHSSDVPDRKDSASTEGEYNTIDDGSSGQSPDDEMIAKTQNERRYRLLLTHDYHPSLTLPLWDPSPVEIGAVGFLAKPQGRFVTLFNAFTPDKSNDHGIQSLPSIIGYGPTESETYRQDRRSVGQKGMDVVASLLTFRPFPVSVSRCYSYPLKAGHKMAYLCTEITDYQYLDNLDAPKKWFQAHIDFIVETYASRYHLQKEEICLVIGTLSAPNHALLVSHSHPEGHAQFNVYATAKDGEPWGFFATGLASDDPEHGPSYDEPNIEAENRVEATKVSCHGGPWDTVLLARLRFKPDVLEPTSK